MKALGLDPGFAKFGWAVADLGGLEPNLIALGLIATAKDKRKVLASTDLQRRAQEIARGLVAVLDAHPGIGVVCAESISYVRSSVVMSQIGMAWGVVHTLSELRGLPVLQCSPQESRKATAGIVSASKEDVQAALGKRFGEDYHAEIARFPMTKREHPADALAAIVACSWRQELRLAMAAREAAE